MSLKDELLKASGELITSAAAVPVQKVNQSTGSKVMAGALPVTGIVVTGLMAAFGNLNPWAQAVIIGIAILSGAFVWDRSKERQARLQLALVEKAANPEVNAVEIEPPPAKAG